MEWCLAASLLILLSPLLVLLGIIVKLHTPGPALYSQIRLGRNGLPFRIYKYRTMTHNCERKSGAVWAQVNDPRITPLGKLLRDTHFDELPQLWNVLRGEMSLIGPRPERPELAGKIEEAVPGFSQRLAIRPGLTGLAQMRLPPDRDMNSVSFKLAQDLFYIRNIGLRMDLKIVIATVFEMIESVCGAVHRLALGKDMVIAPCAEPDANLQAPSVHTGVETDRLSGNPTSAPQTELLAA